MTAAIIKPPTLLDAPRAELARLCRSLCLSYEKDPQGVVLTESDFTRLLDDVRGKFGLDVLSEDDLWEIVREEEGRVVQASLVAEFLLPQIAALLQARADRPSPASPAALPSPSTAAVPPRPAAARAAARPAPLGIADLLEGMLDQERSEARNRPSNPRS